MHFIFFNEPHDSACFIDKVEEIQDYSPGRPYAGKQQTTLTRLDWDINTGYSRRPAANQHRFNTILHACNED
jgi:hypothetical protein